MRDNESALIVVFTSIGVVLVIVMLIGVVGFLISKTPSYDYQRDMVVVDEDNNVLTLQDINGELWVIDTTDAYCDVQGYHLADTLVVYMDDNSTSHTIYDDIIVDVQPLVVNNY